MKKLILFLSIISFTLIPAGVAMAVTDEQLFGDVCSKTPDASVCKDKTIAQDGADNSVYGPDGILSKGADVVTIVVGIAAVIVIIIGGFQFITGVGDPAKISEGRNAIVYALIGLAVAVMAQVVIKFVINKL